MVSLYFFTPIFLERQLFDNFIGLYASSSLLKGVKANHTGFDEQLIWSSAGMTVSTDTEGYLVNPEDWNEDVAIELASEEGLELTDEYWQILNFMRDYYDEHRVAPDVRHIMSCLAREHGYDKKEAKRVLFKLFPYGYVKQACKISGMKRPRAWSTG